MAGVSVRTLHYYDEIGLLRPAGLSPSGYRLYDEKNLDVLQQILFYRELDLPLAQIKTLLESPDFDRERALAQHRAALLRRRERLDRLLATIDRSLNALQEGKTMKNQDKFDGFVREKVERNESQYGAEIRAKYGDRAMDESNARLLALDREQFQSLEEEGSAIYQAFGALCRAGESPRGEQARALAARHFAFLQNYGDFYTLEVYRGLGEGYGKDERFRAFYENIQEGLAGFVREAVVCFVEQAEKERI